MRNVRQLISGKPGFRPSSAPPECGAPQLTCARQQRREPSLGLGFRAASPGRTSAMQLLRRAAWYWPGAVSSADRAGQELCGHRRPGRTGGCLLLHREEPPQESRDSGR